MGKRYCSMMFWVPHGDDGEIVRALRVNGIRSSDVGVVSSAGRLIELWIPEGDVSEIRGIDDLVGSFM